ncbi:hypothetical protein DFH28DRAFT_833831, partial [Melampsora americana]
MNTVSNLTAVLGSMTPGPNTDIPDKERAVAQSDPSGSSSFGRYNKQLLISKYLNRGK